MAGYTHLNVRADIGDFAAEQGVAGMEIRFPSAALGLGALWDALRVSGPAWRCFETGDEGLTLVVAALPRWTTR